MAEVSCSIKVTAKFETIFISLENSKNFLKNFTIFSKKIGSFSNLQWFWKVFQDCYAFSLVWLAFLEKLKIKKVSEGTKKSLKILS